MAEQRIESSWYSGMLKIGDQEVECHVLTDETRVITSRGVIKQLTGSAAGSGSLARYLSRLPLKNNTIKVLPDIKPIRFHAQGGIAYGYRAEDVCEIFTAYAEAYIHGSLSVGRSPGHLIAATLPLVVQHSKYVRQYGLAAATVRKPTVRSPRLDDAWKTNSPENSYFRERY